MPTSQYHDFWFTTSGTETFLTSGTETFITSGGSTILYTPTPTDSRSPTGLSYTSFTPSSTDSVPSDPSPPPSRVPSTPLLRSSDPVMTSATPSSAPVFNAVEAGPVCLGDGIDASAGGILAVLLIPTVIGLIIWLLFAIVRPQFRQIYAVREWFVQQDIRPKPLGSSLLAFLFPHVPLVPSVPADVSDAGRSPSTDAELFPSDEQLSQRTLWLAFLIVAGWSILALGGALPLYLVDTTCLARTTQPAQYGGVYSTLQDISLLRLLQRLDAERSGSSGGALMKRAISSSIGNARIRIIILSAFVAVLATLPALYKILNHYKCITLYRARWIETRCGGMEIGWLSARRAPGFSGWGEKRVKDFLVKNGLSANLDSHNGQRSRRKQRTQSTDEEKHLEVDVQSLFTITDTHKLAVLIEERDEILDQLEIAETRYIESFRSVTPDPSVADFFSEEPDAARPAISRPRPLTGTRRRVSRTRNPAFGSSSYAPSSYMLPSSYYKLRRIEGVSSPLASSAGELLPEPSLSESFRQRVVGSRFQEVQNRPSVVWGSMPIGTPVRPDEKGVLHPIDAPPIPDPARFGPNHIGREENGIEDEDWIDLQREREENADNSWYASAQSGPSERPESTAVQTSGYTPRDPRISEASAAQAADAQRRPLIWDYPASHRSTFPMRPARYSELDPAHVPAPHLRLQSHGPFFRPVSGLAHDDLGTIYTDISYWRSKLKISNEKISEAQNDGYGDIAEGKGVKGWLIVGRGVRFLPGVQLIEGRAKEDIRWHELQHEGGKGHVIAIIVICIVVALLLAAGLFAAAALSLGTAPDFAHYVSFLQPLRNQNDWTTGLVTGLCASVAATLFIAIAVAILHYTNRLSTEVSISMWELTSLKMTFWVLTIVGFVFLTVAGALLFAVRAFDLHDKRSATVANGSIYMTALLLAMIINVAVIAPGLLLLQPVRLWTVKRAERHALTPRHRFRSIYPRGYNPTFAMGCCILAIVIASAFSLLFPIIGPAVVLLVFLTLVAHRFLVGYVYARTHSQTGGLLQLWLLRRFATLTSLQPLILGLILLTRRLWPEGGALCGFAVLVMLVAEIYCTRTGRLPGPASLGPLTRRSIETFGKMAKPGHSRNSDEESTDLVADSAGMNPRARGSFASVLEMMSINLAVMPGKDFQGPVPLQTETIDDLTGTERAARSHPDAPPHLPLLPFTDHDEELSGILYAPELVSPPPTIWLPNDRAGVARGESYDLMRYHGLRATVDVRSQEDVVTFRDNERRRPSGESAKGAQRKTSKQRR